VFVLVADEIDLVVVLEVERENLSVVILCIVDPPPTVAQFSRLTPRVSFVSTDDVRQHLKTPPDGIFRDVTHEEEKDDFTLVRQNRFLTEGGKFLDAWPPFCPASNRFFEYASTFGSPHVLPPSSERLYSIYPTAE